MSTARTKKQAVPWSLPLIGTMPLNQQYQILGALGGLCLVAAVLLFFASIRETMNNAVYLTTATEMQMLSQRLAKGAQQAVLGNISGFIQLQQGRNQFAANLNKLINGSANVPAATKLAQADLDAINQLWAPMEQKASLILSQKTDLVNLSKNVLAINNNNPRLLELAQEVESTLTTNNAPVRSVRVASRQVMLTQKLAKNANALLSDKLVDPEVAFLLAKDTNTFRDNLLGLINGSEEMLIAPTKDQESLDRIKNLQDAFKEFEGSVTSILQNQQKLIQAKQSGQSIFVDSEELLALLQKLTDRFHVEAEKQGTLIAAILSAVLMLIFLALMGFASMFDANRRVLELKQADEALQKANEELEKRVQERTADLKAAHERINHILASSPVVLYSFKASGDYAPTFVSKNLQEMFGYEAGDYLEDRNFVPDRIHPDDAGRVKGRLSSLFEKGYLSNEYRFRCKDGHYCWVSDELKVIYDKAGKPVEVIGSWEDINARKQAEAALGKQTRYLQLLKKIAVAANEASVIEEALQICLDEVCSLTGWPVGHAYMLAGDDTGELIPTKLWHLDNPGIFKTFRQVTEQTRFAAGIGLPGRVLGSGKPAWIIDVTKDTNFPRAKLAEDIGVKAAFCFPVLVGSKVAAVLEFYTPEAAAPDEQLLDVMAQVGTQLGLVIERKQAEKEIVEANARLQEQELDLREAKSVAVQASKMKSEFLANMSHEIRTPINAVIGMTHLALQTELTERQRNYLGKVDAAAKGLLGVINDVLDFSKIEAGKLHTEQVEFSLGSVLEQVADVSDFKAQDKGLELLFDEGMDVPTALIGDPLRLRQVLLNLVGNAIKFTEKGEVTVGVQLLAAQNSMAHLRFDVKDSGIGLTPEQRTRLFSAFSQADASTTRKYGGTGLGLSISKGLVEAMGGEIGVESEPGAGSTFYFTAKFGLQAEQRPVLPLTPHLQGMRVLVVDDNASAREIFLSMLHCLKFEPSAVASGAAAIDALRQAQSEGKPYGLVLMDWRMPGMNGVEAIRSIQADASLENTPTFIMATAFSHEELLEEAKDIAFAGLLAKPVSPSTLLDSIMAAFGKEVVQAPRQPVRHGDFRETARQVRGAHLLLVEDNAVNQEITVEILSNAGIAVDVANNGVEAIDKVQQTHYDGVLMDCQMPLLDGYEATRRLRTDARFRELPIIAMTANVMAGDRERCIEAGMNDHVGKPIDVNELFSTLARWIKRDTGETAASTAEASPEDAPPICIPGVDVVQALKRVGGSIKLYRKLLSRFCETQTDAVQRIREAIGRADFETARRDAHTLKGLAASIGITAVADCAGTLEGLLKAGKTTDLTRDLVNLEKPLSESLTSLRGSVLTTGSGKEPPPTERPPVDMAALGAAIGDLAKLIAQDDTRAAKAFEAIAGDLRAAGQGEGSMQLQNLLAQYDFESAAAVLEKMAQELAG